MVISASHSSPQDPFSLVESCQKAIEWILRSYTAQGKPIPRCWIDVRYEEVPLHGEAAESVRPEALASQLARAYVFFK